jgi:hypothetical protein
MLRLIGGVDVDRSTVGVWVGGRWVDVSVSDWGEHLRTTGSGPHTTLDLTDVRNSLGPSHNMSY